MKKYLLLIALLGSQCLASVTVKLASPISGSTVGGAIQLQASASSTHPIVGWHAYLDTRNVFTAGGTSYASGTINASAGRHTLVVRAWDSTGAYGDQTVVVNVGSNGAPVAPTNAPVTVALAAPAANSSVGTTFSLQASASSSHPIVGWHAYIDSSSVYYAGATANINTNLNVGAGTHTIVVRAWDSTGAYGDKTVTFTAASGSPAPTPIPTNGLPTPPSTAKVFNNIEQMGSGWVPCGDPACAGCSGNGNYWQALFQTSPSMDGSSMELYRDGAWGNALWHHKMGPINSVTNFLSDFYFYLDNNSLKGTQALEYEAFQFVGGYNYMMGSQCDYGLGVFDTWSEASGRWLPTNIPCPKFAPNTWHHIQWYITVNHANHSYTYRTLVVDGHVYNLNQTQYAKYLAWGDNLGAQWQLDDNASGIGYHEWIDKAKLTVW
jgi:hypothetical protein